MAGWKQEDGNTVTAIGGFNDEIAAGEKFQGGHKISMAWDKYIGTHFEPAGEPNTDDENSKEESNPKQKQKRRRADPTTQVTHEDGEIWIGDLVGTLSELFAPTYHGSRSGLCLPKGSRAIQETAPVHQCDGGIRASAPRGKGKGKEKNKGKAPTENAGGVQAIGNMQPSAKVAANRMEQPTSGKIKGKEKDKGKVPTENVGGVRDIGNMQPIGQVATKNAERPQPCQKGATKHKAPVPSRQAIQSTAAMQISATSQPAKMPTKMPKDKHTSKKVNPVMVPVLGSEQESDSDHNNKSYDPSQ
ncbi:hypothetical protein PAXRUDRAFT_22207 [Paxillus rubicundulus Ve08.2h10]|uniref:Uncharacterized protein n=1 Tax=Paxillus rubicundulus Ve08.2h10 TaxID=930991 RepID=A0A0D0BKQ2_9AGAM|nr:hypothetical protein PAXRUDRAFT_22207 [Paxillus rubicundulus Ve08.2h10]